MPLSSRVMVSGLTPFVSTMGDDALVTCQRCIGRHGYIPPWGNPTLLSPGAICELIVEQAYVLSRIGRMRSAGKPFTFSSHMREPSGVFLSSAAFTAF
jgi:hypothetical protein